jgi:pimeloyl-ACP methyl ester carboxylesterase
MPSFVKTCRTCASIVFGLRKSREHMALLDGPSAIRDSPGAIRRHVADAVSVMYLAVCAWGIPNHSLLQRLAAIDLPVFVANGDSDTMIPPGYSYLLAGLLPNARIKLYPDPAHGFQYRLRPSSGRASHSRTHGYAQFALDFRLGRPL